MQPIGEKFMPKDEIQLKRESEQKEGAQVKPQVSCHSSAEASEPCLKQLCEAQAVEATQQKQGTVPPSQEKAGYVSVSAACLRRSTTDVGCKSAAVQVADSES